MCKETDILEVLENINKIETLECKQLHTGNQYLEKPVECQELNLQSVRRNLIQLIEDFEALDCIRCKLLKCHCDPNSPTPPQSLTPSTPSLTENISSPSELGGTPYEPTPPWSWPTGALNEFKSPPPAFELPRPDFTQSNLHINKDVESWVRASTPNPDKTDSPGSKPFTWINSRPPQTIWNDYKHKFNKPEINTSTVAHTGNVHDFFRSFNINLYAVGSKTHSQNRALMQRLKDIAHNHKKSEYAYTYF